MVAVCLGHTLKNWIRLWRQPEKTTFTFSAGDPAPWFVQRSASNPRYVFDTAAGRYFVLCFYGSAAEPLGKAALDAVFANRQQFDDIRICFFGVSLDPADESSG